MLPGDVSFLLRPFVGDKSFALPCGDEAAAKDPAAGFSLAMPSSMSRSVDTSTGLSPTNDFDGLEMMVNSSASSGASGADWSPPAAAAAMPTAPTAPAAAARALSSPSLLPSSP